MDANGASSRQRMVRVFQVPCTEVGSCEESIAATRKSQVMCMGDSDIPMSVMLDQMRTAEAQAPSKNYKVMSLDPMKSYGPSPVAPVARPGAKPADDSQDLRSEIRRLEFTRRQEVDDLRSQLTRLEEAKSGEVQDLRNEIQKLKRELVEKASSRSPPRVREGVPSARTAGVGFATPRPSPSCAVLSPLGRGASLQVPSGASLHVPIVPSAPGPSLGIAGASLRVPAFSGMSVSSSQVPSRRSLGCVQRPPGGSMLTPVRGGQMAACPGSSPPVRMCNGVECSGDRYIESSGTYSTADEVPSRSGASSSTSAVHSGCGDFTGQSAVPLLAAAGCSRSMDPSCQLEAPALNRAASGCRSVARCSGALSSARPLWRPQTDAPLTPRNPPQASAQPNAYDCTPARLRPQAPQHSVGIPLASPPSLSARCAPTSALSPAPAKLTPRASSPVRFRSQTPAPPSEGAAAAAAGAVAPLRLRHATPERRPPAAAAAATPAPAIAAAARMQPAARVQRTCAAHRSRSEPARQF